MKYNLPCILYAISVVSASTIKGIDPKKLELYQPSSTNTWTCLDGSKTIPFKAINDDYCDCPDGSDEPGTSACSNGWFYCENIGHLPSYIKSSQVNDGVCDEACCDGSDENGDLVHCPNRCQEVGETYRKQQSSLMKSIEQGLQVKSKLIEEASQQIMKWQEEMTKMEDEIFLKKGDVLKLERELKAHDKQQSKCQSNKGEISSLKQTVVVLKKNLNQLKEILSEMKLNHNHNFHDMAVKGAITAYDEFVERYTKIEEEISQQLEMIDEQGEDEEEIVISDEEDNTEEQEEQNQEEEKEPNTNKHSVFDIVYEKLDSVLPSNLKNVVDKLLPKKQETNVTTEPKQSKVELLRKAKTDLENEINSLNTNFEKIKDELEQDYGHENEWLKLKDVCVEKNEGEYTYSFCILGGAYQKSNKDSTSIHLGDFTDFIGVEDVYTVHSHEHGTRCWNGPDRSVKVYFECGANNEILSVTEPEKCEYHFTAKTPAVCKRSE